MQTPARAPDSTNNFVSSFSSNKKLGILTGVAAAIAIIAIVGFTSTDFVPGSVAIPLLVNVDQNAYYDADIISITGDTISDAESIQLTIENTNGCLLYTSPSPRDRG